MSVLWIRTTVTEMLTVSILKVATSVCAGEDMKEMADYVQVHTNSIAKIVVQDFSVTEILFSINRYQ